MPPEQPEPWYANVGLFLSLAAASTLVGAYTTEIRYLALLFVVLPMAALGLILSSVLALPPSSFGARSIGAAVGLAVERERRALGQARANPAADAELDLALGDGARRQRGEDDRGREASHGSRPSRAALRTASTGLT